MLIQRVGKSSKMKYLNPRHTKVGNDDERCRGVGRKYFRIQLPFLIFPIFILSLTYILLSHKITKAKELKHPMLSRRLS